MSTEPTWRLDNSTGSDLWLELSGDWTAGFWTGLEFRDLPDVIHSCPPSSLLRIRLSDTSRWDSALIAALLELGQLAKSSNRTLDVSGLPEGVRGLFKLATASPARPEVIKQSRQLTALEQIGNSSRRIFLDLIELTKFLGQTVLSMRSFLLGRARFRSIDLWLQIQECGPAAVPIVTLISLLVGLILAFVGAVQLALFGAQIYIADLVALGMTREMGALMTAVIMAGRSGAAFAAQIGSMNVNLEVSALRVMGFPPTDFLVIPRMLALILVMPFLCIYADLLGVIGGGLVSISFFDIPFTQFVHRTADAVHLTDFFVGLTKAVIFGGLIAFSGCARGIQCGRSASAVGDAATSSVVTSIVFIVVADSIVTLICDRLHI